MAASLFRNTAMTENFPDFTDCVRQALRHLFTTARLSALLPVVLMLPVFLLLAGKSGGAASGAHREGARAFGYRSITADR
jgi:hypothetical protein